MSRLGYEGTDGTVRFAEQSVATTTTIDWPSIYEILPKIIRLPNLPCFQDYRYISNCEVGKHELTPIEQQMQADHSRCRKHIRPRVLEEVTNTRGLIELLEAYETIKSELPEKACFPSIKNYLEALYDRIATVEELNNKLASLVFPETLHTTAEISVDTDGASPVLQALRSYNARKQYNEYARQNLFAMLAIQE